MYDNLIWSYLCVFGLAHIQLADGGIPEPCVTPENSVGKCVDIRQCPTITKMLQGPRPLPTETVEYLKRSQCGFEGRNPLVCCGKTEVVTKKPPKVGRPPADVSNHPTLRLLPEHCGSITQDRITNGNETSLYEFPWMALLGYNTDSTGLKYRCGGSLINPKYVLTAAHCVTHLNNLKLVTVRLGEHDQGTELDCHSDWGCAPPVQDFDIERVVPHPQYDKDGLSNDIALVRIRGAAKYNSGVRPICLPVGKEQQKTLDGQTVIVSGWGTTEYGISSQVLLKVDLPIVSTKDCSATYKAVARITERQLCAGGEGGKDSCNGDSGGPLLFAGRPHMGGVGFIQHGIVSFGPKSCGVNGKPGVYTRVAYYMDWILNNIRD